jgi:hypothetical protein
MRLDTEPDLPGCGDQPSLTQLRRGRESSVAEAMKDRGWLRGWRR